MYWVAQVNRPDVQIILSNEHVDYKWLDLNQAMDIVGHEQTKKVLIEADGFIKKTLWLVSVGGAL